MSERQFEYGPILKGIFFALQCLTVLVVLFATSYAAYYILILLFLGIGLRPLLEKTGLYHWLTYSAQRVEARLQRKQLEKHRADIDMKARDLKYKLSRSRDRDPKLPKNW